MDIENLSKKKGFETLIKQAEIDNIKIKPEIDKIKARINKSIWMRIKHPSTFKEAATWYELETKSKWIDRVGIQEEKYK